MECTASHLRLRDRPAEALRPPEEKVNWEQFEWGLRVNEEGHPHVEAREWPRGSDRRRSGDLTIFSRALYQLSYRALPLQGSKAQPLARVAVPCDPDRT